jgi:hypothetical protein
MIDNAKGLIQEAQQKIQGEVFAAEAFQVPQNQNPVVSEYAKGFDTYDVHEGHEHSWITNGFDDTVPYLLKEMYRRSSIHNSAVNAKAALVSGSGWEYTPLERYYAKDADGRYELKEQSLSEAKKQELALRAKLFEKNVGGHRYLIDAAMQLALFGGYYGFETIALNPRAEQEIRRLKVEGYEKCRLGSKKFFDGYDYRSQFVYLSNNWFYAQPYKVLKYDEWAKGVRVFGQGDMTFLPYRSAQNIDEFGRGIYVSHHGRITPFRNHYCTADYESIDAANYISIDYMLSKYDYKGLESGFSLDCIIVRYRNKLDNDVEEKQQRQKDRDFIKKNYRGFAGERTMMLWATPQVDDTGKPVAQKLIDIIEIPANKDSERLKLLREERMMKILNAHSIITPEIIGLPNLNSTGFSSQSELLITAMEVLYFQSIRPLQKYVVEDYQEKLIASGIPVKPSIKNAKVNFRKLTEKLVMWMLSLNEARKLYDFDEMSDEVAKEVLNRINKREADEESSEQMRGQVQQQ